MTFLLTGKCWRAYPGHRSAHAVDDDGQGGPLDFRVVDAGNLAVGDAQKDVDTRRHHVVRKRNHLTQLQLRFRTDRADRQHV